MKVRLFTLGVSLAFASSSFAASLIDFEGLPPSLPPERYWSYLVPGGSLTYTVDGVPVTFSAFRLSVDISNPIPGNHTLRSGSFVDPITVTFGGGFTADFIEIRNLFDATSTIETDIITASAYSASGTFLGSVSSSDSILHLACPGIARIVFDDVAGTAFSIDDFTFQAIPEPASLSLLAVSVAIVSVRCMTKPRSLCRASR